MPFNDTQTIHGFFGLSYASYLVLPRSVMQAMPLSWQRRVVALLEQAGEEYGDLYGHHRYDVRLVADTDWETGEPTRFGPDPLANYRHPIPELRPQELDRD